VLYGERYLEGRKDADTLEFKRFVEHELHYCDFRETLTWYEAWGEQKFRREGQGFPRLQ
jgi:hypothetical protein